MDSAFLQKVANLTIWKFKEIVKVGKVDDLHKICGKRKSNSRLVAHYLIQQLPRLVRFQGPCQRRQRGLHFSFLGPVLPRSLDTVRRKQLL